MQRKLHPTPRSAAERRRQRAQQVQARRFCLVVAALALVVIVTAVGSYASRAEAAPQTEKANSTQAPTTTLDPSTALVSSAYTAALAGDFGDDGPQARLILRYDAQSETVSYSLEITSPLPNPAVASICKEVPGQKGATVFNMFSGPAIAGNFSGMLAQGEISASDLVGPLQGARIADLVLLLKEGGAYATVGTAGMPVDAIRGRIE